MHSKHFRTPNLGFTLIEVMVVVGIMGLIALAGVPTLYRFWKGEGLRKSVRDVVEVCGYARARAILLGAEVQVVFHPRDRRFAIEGGGGNSSGSNVNLDLVGAAAGFAKQTSAQLPEDIFIEMLDINLSEYRESDWARVRFFPNGTSDELTLVLRSSKNEWKKITLEVTTGLASVDNVR